MKKHLFLSTLALVLTVQTAFTQEIKIKKDTAFVDSKPLCILKSRNMSTEYRILSLKGKELIFAKLQEGAVNYFDVSFLESGDKCEREYEGGFGKKIIRDLYERGALTLTSEDINNEGLKKFLLTNTRKYSDGNKPAATTGELIGILIDKASEAPVKTQKSSKTITLVERNTSKSVSTEGKNITQDFKTIGSYKEQDNGVTGKKITILSVDGVPIAEVVFKSMGDNVGKIFTFTDREEDDYRTKESLNSFMFVREIAQYLIDKRYL